MSLANAKEIWSLWIHQESEKQNKRNAPIKIWKVKWRSRAGYSWCTKRNGKKLYFPLFYRRTEIRFSSVSSRSLSKMQNNFPSLFFFVVVVEKFDRWWQNTISTISNQQFPLKLNTCFFFYFRYMARREKEVQREKRSIVVEQIKFVYRQRKKCGADRNIVTMLHDTMHRRRKKKRFFELKLKGKFIEIVSVSPRVSDFFCSFYLYTLNG